MRKFSVSTLLVAVLAVGLANAQSQQKNSPIVKLDPALDAVVSPTAKVEILKDEYFGLGEGPVWVNQGQSGYLLFSDIGANAIYKWTADGKLSVFLEHSGYNSTDVSQLQTKGYLSSFNGRMYTGAFGSNGLTFDPQGRLLWCAQGDRAIVRLEKDGKTRTVLADHFEGKRLNRPNDLVVKSDGAIYFTDPRSNNPGASMELATSAVFLLPPNGKLQMIESEYQPNGIVFSPDEKYLYVGGGGKIWRYDVKADDTVSNRKVFYPDTGCDGMKMDQKGNLYCASRGIEIFSPEGKHLGTIQTPDNLTNFAFGDADGKTLYITSKRTLSRIRLNNPGVRPKS
jgi:gluconolactonase